MTSLQNVTYLASHPKVSSRLDKIDLIFTTEGISIKRSVLGELSWSTIDWIAADDREGLDKRVTATRVLLTGVFALALKKKTVLSYLIVAQADGDWIFAIPGLTKAELSAGINQLYPYAQIGQPEPETVAQSPADRLRELQSLLSDGLVTEAEFAERRDVLMKEL